MPHERPGGHTPDSLLATQFEDPERTKDISIYDLRPERLKTEVPTTVIPGWTLEPATIREFLLSLAQKERRILAYDAPHGIDDKTARNTARDDVSETPKRKIAALFETLNEKSIDKTDLVGISEGGIYAALAASLQPDRFRSLVLVESAGLINEDQMLRIAVGFSRDVAQDIIKNFKNRKMLKTALKALGGIGKSIILHPQQSVREVIEISNAQICDILEELRTRGVRVAIVHAVDDKGFPMNKVQENVHRRHVDGFYSIRGSHNSFLTEPEKTAIVIDNALDALEKKKEGVK